MKNPTGDSSRQQDAQWVLGERDLQALLRHTEEVTRYEEARELEKARLEEPYGARQK